MGKIEIDHTGSGGGITLSSDGTDLLLDGTAVGGGGADLYAANESSPTAQPSATGANAIAIGDSAVASGADAIAIGDGSTSSSTRSIAIGYNSTSSGIASTALGPSANASGFYGTALGYNAKAVSGGLSSVVAMGNSYASGDDSFAAAIANNTSSYGATGANSIAIGYQAKATAEYSASFGQSNNVTGAYGAAFGRGNTVSSSGYCFGAENTSSASLAYAFGQKASSSIVGKFAFATSRFSSNGDAQEGKYILRSDTTNATAEALTTTNGTADATNQIILPNNSAYAFHGTIVARQNASGGTASAAWKIEGLIRREANAGTTTLVNSATTVLDNTPSWGMALSADTTNGGLKIEVTGAASTNIRWVATIHTSEVTYA